MKDYKFIRVLKQLSNQDIARLKLFLDSPYFKHKAENVLFIKELMNQKSLSDLNYMDLWNKIDKTDFNEQRLRKKLHECLLIIESFIGYERFTSSDLQQSKNLLNETVERNLNELIPKSIKAVEDSLKKERALTFDYYSHRFHLFNTMINISGGFDRKIALKKNRDSSEYLIKADKILNEIFLSEKLRLTHLLNNDNSVSNKNDKLTFVDEVYDFAKKTARQGSKPYFYLKLIELSHSEDRLGDIERLHKYISVKNSLFSYEEFRNIIFTLLNEVIRIINSGNLEGYSLAFKLYRTGLTNKSFFNNAGELLPDTFKNICSTAARVGEIEWALNFIREYQSFINYKFRETAVAFNRAIIYRRIGDYEKVIENLRSVEYEDLGYNLRSKGMLLIAYFELEEFDALDSLIKAFNVYLRRKTNISEKRKTFFKNFNSLIQDIVRAKERRDKVKLKTVRKKLESKMVAPNKDWLMEKVVELEKELGVKSEV